MAIFKAGAAYNGWNSEIVLLSIVEELETDSRQYKFSNLSVANIHIIASDDTGFAG